MRLQGKWKSTPTMSVPVIQIPRQLSHCHRVPASLSYKVPLWLLSHSLKSHIPHSTSHMCTVSLCYTKSCMLHLSTKMNLCQWNSWKIETPLPRVPWNSNSNASVWSALLKIFYLKGSVHLYKISHHLLLFPLLSLPVPTCPLLSSLFLSSSHSFPFSSPLPLLILFSSFILPSSPFFVL